jgi:pyruvate kinase
VASAIGARPVSRFGRDLVRVASDAVRLGGPCLPARRATAAAASAIRSVEAVRAMSVIAGAAEESPDLRDRARRGDVNAGTAAAAVLHAAVQLADELDAAAIVVPTATGGSARACSKYRPRNPIIALAHDPLVAEQLTLEWGVYPVVADVADSLDELVDVALRVARYFAGLGSGDRVVTNGQQPGAPGATNTVIERALP